jgi:hypothetical protein
MAAALSEVVFVMPRDATVVRCWQRICGVRYEVQGSAVVGFAGRTPRAHLAPPSPPRRSRNGSRHCFASPEQRRIARRGSGREVSFVLEWETEGMVACDWDEDGEEVSHVDEQEDGEEKREREEESCDKEEATRTLRDEKEQRSKEKERKKRDGKGKVKGKENKKNKGKRK